MAAALAAGCSDESPAPEGVSPLQTRDTPARFALPAGEGHLAGLLRGPAVVRGRPGGRVIGRLGRHTPFGSPTSVWVRASRDRGRWIGVVSTATPDGRLGWIDRARTRVALYRTRISLRADLSERTLEVRERGGARRRIEVTIGAPATPTPTGSFAVTDKLDPMGSPNPYGCCILALSGRQPHLRPGWAGGDRIAIHGSSADRAGEAASAGCLRARDHDLRALMRLVVLGTPVVIRA